MTHGSLFSGIGGFDLAAEWMGWENAFHCEINPFCQKVLKYHFPKSVSYADIKTTDFSIWRGRIDVLTGGFPCQPFSVAGEQLGKEHNQYLIEEMLRVSFEVMPKWIVAENVPGIASRKFSGVYQNICVQMENKGYKVQSFNIPASAVGAKHTRERVWFVAYASGFGCERREQGLCSTQKNGYDKKSGVERKLQPSWFGNSLPTSRIFRRTNGVSDGVDRIKALGNAIVPQVAFQIFKTIAQYELYNLKTI